MRKFAILSLAVFLTACGGTPDSPDCDPSDGCRRVHGSGAVSTTTKISCSEKMYNLGELIRSLHSLGYSRSAAMDHLVNNYGPSMYQLRDMTSVVWSMPKGHWARGEIGNQMRAAAMAQGCV